VALHIKNVPVDDVQSGYTKDASVSELVLLSVSLLFGRPLGYSDKSGGAPIQDLYPKRAHAVKQLGTGSVPLVFHTEDPHLLFSPDYVALLCLRGDPNAATEFAKIELADLDPETVPELEKPQFVLRSDESFDTSDRSLTTSIVSIDAFGTRVRYEPIFVEFLNERGREALEALTNYIHSHAERVVLDKGEMLILDNRRAVHGRSGYQPRYDGKDRWVQRSNIFLEEVPDHIVSSSNPFLML
jgi:L-asparagine oxygenase